MSQDEISLKDLREGDPLTPITPLLNETSLNLHHSHSNLWGSSLHIPCRSHYPHSFHTANPIKAWILKSRSVFKRRAVPTNAAEITHEQTTHLIWEDIEATSDVPTIEDGPRFASLEYLGPWFPGANPIHPKPQTWRTWRSKRQMVLICCSIVATLILFINVAATVYFKIKWKTVGDLGTIYRGDCSQSHRLSSSLHIIINVLSTTLLAASNLCMQLLAAPTRQEIDKAHGNYVWLDIGVPSFRNLKHISKWRSRAVFFLATSSIPLHFLYV